MMMVDVDVAAEFCTACWLGDVTAVQNLLRQVPFMDINATSFVARRATQESMEREAESRYRSAMAVRHSWPSNWKTSTKQRHRRDYNRSCEQTKWNAVSKARSDWARLNEVWRSGMPRQISPLGWAIAGSTLRDTLQVVQLLQGKGANAHLQWGNEWCAFRLAEELQSPVRDELPPFAEFIRTELGIIARTGNQHGLDQLVAQFGNDLKRYAADSDVWEAGHPLLNAALANNEKFMKPLLDAGVSIRGVDQDTVNELPVSELAREIFRGHDITPPELTYPSEELRLTYGAQVGDEWRPQLGVGNALAVQEFVLAEGTLPEGLILDPATGQIFGAPKVACRRTSVSVAASNVIQQGPVRTLFISVTSDLMEMLDAVAANLAPLLDTEVLQAECSAAVESTIKEFPTSASLKEKFLKEKDVHAALHSHLERVSGINNVEIRDSLVKALREQVTKPSTPFPAFGFAISPADVTIGQPIGAGGQAVVHEAQWNGVRVAAKVFRFGSVNKQIQKARKELDKEIQALSALRHIHIVQLYGYFIEPVQTVMVLEFCSGGDLDDFCQDQPLPVKLGLVGQVLSALGYLHSQQPPVIHGDIKPGNVLVHAGIAKLADFGMCAGVVTTKFSTASSSVGFGGTVPYAAPEMFDERINPAADIYSMAILLWEVVEGSEPWQGQLPLRIMKQVTDGNRPDLTDELWSPQLSQTVQHWWAQDPSVRPTAVEALKAMIHIESAMRIGVPMADFQSDDIDSLTEDRQTWEVEMLALESAKRDSLMGVARNRQQLRKSLEDSKTHLQASVQWQIDEAHRHLLGCKAAAEEELATVQQSNSNWEAEARAQEDQLQHQVEQRKQELVEKEQALLSRLAAIDGERRRRYAELEAQKEELTCQLFTCCICFENVPALDGVRCQRPDADQRHFMCGDCFSEHVRHSSDHDLDITEKRNGKILCPFPRCESPCFTDVMVFLIASEAAISAYLGCQARLNEKRTIEQVEPALRQQIAAEFERRHNMDADARAVHDARKHIVDQILTSTCPRCRQAFLDFDGCCALTCSKCSCGFCAYCLADCGGDAHVHVASCKFGVGTFASREQYQECRRAFVSQQLAEYLQASVEPRLQEEVIAACHEELADRDVAQLFERLNL